MKEPSQASVGEITRSAPLSPLTGRASWTVSETGVPIQAEYLFKTLQYEIPDFDWTSEMRIS